MSLKKYSLPIVVIVIIAAITSTAYIFSSMWPEYENQFIEIALLDGNHKTVDYFPNDEHIIHLGTPLHWNIYLHNYRAVESRIKIVTKILNSTDAKPDDFLGVPSTREPMASHEVTLEKNEKTFIPIDWSIYDLHYNDIIYLDSILYNNNVIYLDNTESKDGHFVMVFELWVNNDVTGDYSYVYIIDNESRSSSVYMNFLLGIR